jgi:Xaa-Pro dipeptidase
MELPRIPFEAYRERAKRARALMDRHGIDVLFAAPSKNFRYLTGCEIPRSERFVALLFRRESDPAIIAPFFERDRILSCPLKMRPELWSDDEDPMRVMRRLIGDAPGITVALGPRTDFSAYMQLVRGVPEVRWVDGSVVFDHLRCEKTPDEVCCIEAAVTITEKTFATVPSILRQGMTERELAEKLMTAMNNQGGERTEVLVQFGTNTSVPHGVPGGRSLAVGDVVMIDMGTAVGGYHADLTRVYAYRKVSDAVRQVYTIVRQAQSAAFERVRAGVPAEAVDAAARDVIDRHEHGIHFTRRTGHGIGLDGHEPPYLVLGNAEPLRPGMTVAIEPGIYLGGRFGVRLEDQVLVTDSGARMLSSGAGEMPVVG